MKKIILVRHGETEGNIRRVIQGQSQDFRLTERGKKQMARVSAFLKRECRDAVVWSSSLERALDSANVLVQTTGFVGPFTLEELQQRHWGSSTGSSYDTRSGETAYLGEPGIVLPNDAEFLSAIQERLQNAKRIIQAHEKETHIIVGHNELLNYLLDVWSEKPFRKYTFLSGETHLFENIPSKDAIVRTQRIFPPRLVYFRDTRSLLSVQEAVGLLRSHHLEPITEISATEKEDVVAVVLGDASFTSNDAAEFPHLRTVARFGAGWNNVEVKGIWERQHIPTSCTIGMASRDVAEFALGALISSLRMMHTDCFHLRADKFEWRSIKRGISLRDATIGIVGCGRIGFELAEILSNFGTKVLLWNRSWPPTWSAENPESVEKLEKYERILRLEEIAEKVDAVSLHLTLTRETTHIIGEAFFEKLRQGEHSIALVNTSRGDIVDEAALLHALHSGIVRSAAIDVWSAEGKQETEVVRQIRNHPSVLATSHIAANTVGVSHRYSMQCARNIIAAVEGRYSEVQDFIVRLS